MLPLQLCLCAAVLPAVGTGMWLLRIAGAPRSVAALQVVAVAAGLAVHAAMVRSRTSTVDMNQWLSALVVAGLFLPLSMPSHGGPARWLEVGSLRLYVAPLLLPLAVFQLGRSRQRLSVYTTTVVAVVIALALQPDASQLTAFAVAMAAPLAAGDRPWRVRVGLWGLVLGVAGVAWRTPEKLMPVPYVEGVFAVAATVSPWALGVTLLAAALPVATFAWASRRLRSPGVLAIALYWAALFALAPFEVTPVPWLGFGAGPIFGYFLAAGVVSRAVADETGRPGIGVQPPMAGAVA